MTEADIIRELIRIVGPRAVLWRPDEIAVYTYDASVARGRPLAVVLPDQVHQVVDIVRLARREGVPVVPRGAGTGLSGGAVAAQGGIMVVTTRLRRIIQIDGENRFAIVEPGVVNIELNQAAAAKGLFYAPDPASQTVSTIGGNVAENAGGPHCLAYGVTTNHVLGLEVVLPDGSLITTGGPSPDRPGYDLTGVLVGSEGTLGIVTKVWVRLLPLPEAVRTLLAIYECLEDATDTVSAIIAAGIIPTALELMDKTTLQTVEAAVHAGYPPNAGAALLIEVEGFPEGLDAIIAQIRDICQAHQVTELRLAKTADERMVLWKGRKGALGALGRIAPNYYIHDGVVPRSRLTDVVRQVNAIGEKYGILIANLMHAGDGNLHPNMAFDARQPGMMERVIAAGAEILKVVVAAGGTISGEHGIGLEKQDYMSLMFSPTDLAQMRILHHVFDPDNLLNPGKIFPGTHRARMPEAQAA